MMEHIQAHTPHFDDVIGAFLQKELLHDRVAKLASVGQDIDRRIPLSQVFVDLPATEKAEAAGQPKEGAPGQGLLAEILEAGARSLRANVTEIGPAGKRMQLEGADRGDRYVVVGGPGQGKSTLAQFLCQLYRAAILSDRRDRLDEDARRIIADLTSPQHTDIPALPGVRRFPVRIGLNRFADELARNSEMTLLNYIRDGMSRLGSCDCRLEDLKRWLAVYPWLVVLDGLDEVPASGNRSDVIAQIGDFCVDAANLKADVQMVATTRPQNYGAEFSPERFAHRYLTPLSRTQAMNYARRFVAISCADDEKLAPEVNRRLEKACDVPATARLMQTPLQVTIMATLVRLGEPPRQRYRLFHRYYGIVYDREVAKGGEVSTVLNERKTDIDSIHLQAALLLQREAESAGSAEARLSDDRFRALVRARLEEIGEPAQRKDLLLGQIADSSIERLVFLVRPQPDQVAFEIRSLQEFMAAEALLKGPEAAVVARLTEIAPIIHWRNVFLFAVGKCFAEAEHLLDHVDVICRSLNDGAVITGGGATLWGSRLASEILRDGAAEAHPRQARLLAETALHLLGVPDSKAAAQLADFYDDNLRDLFEKRVRDAFATDCPPAAHSVWTLIGTLASRGISWARDLLRQKLPADSPTQEELLTIHREFLVPALDAWGECYS